MPVEYHEADEKTIGIITTALRVINDREMTWDSQLTQFVINELASGLVGENGRNLKGRAAELLQMAIDDLEAIQFEIEADHNSYVAKEEDWSGVNGSIIIEEARRRTALSTSG